MATFTVTGHFEEGDDTPSVGEVRFTRFNYLFTSGADGIMAPKTYTATLDGSGDVSKVLRGITAGDRPATWSYWVEVDLEGHETQVGAMTLTANRDLVDVMAGWPDGD